MHSSIYYLCKHQFLLASILSFIFYHQNVHGLYYTIDGFCAGNNFACAIINSGQAKCWGQKKLWGSSNLDDGLGDSKNELGDAIAFINFGANLTVSSVYCGGSHVCAKLSTQSMKCIGYNNRGQVGIGVTNPYVGSVSNHIGESLPTVNIGAGLQPLGISLGKQHTCVKVEGNGLKCFGYGAYGILGTGASTDIGLSSTQMGDNLPIINFGTDVTVASAHSGPSSDHSCIILSTPLSFSNRIKCWGYNYNYQLGYGTALTRDDIGDSVNEMGDFLPIVDLGAESRVKQLALGEGHTCAVIFNDDLRCWGYNTWGQLGLGSTTDVSKTGDDLQNTPIDPGMTIRLLGAGHHRTCILYDDSKTMKCVGYNWNGGLGQGTALSKGDSPETMIPKLPAINFGTGSLAIEAFYSGTSFTCVEFVDDTMKCFGSNVYGQLAIGNSNTIGDEPSEIGSGLPFVTLVSPPTFSPTRSPSRSPTPPTMPTRSPSQSPTRTPTTKSPSVTPTRTPTRNPSTRAPTVPPTTSSPTTSQPTKSPTPPTTKSPTSTPTTRSPTTASPTRVPTTRSPTPAPTVKVSTLTPNYIIRFDQGPLNFTQAEKTCQSLYGTHLPTITSSSDQYEVTSKLISETFWIGLNDIDLEGNYVWISGSTSSFRNWDSFEPDGVNALSEDCISVFALLGGWSDVDCSLTYTVLVCDMPRTASPTLPTLSPTSKPTNSPTSNPTTTPSNLPIVAPTSSPTDRPSVKPTLIPSIKPSSSSSPTSKPFENATSMPSQRMATSSPSTSPTQRTKTSPSSAAPLAIGLGVTIPLISVAAVGFLFFKYRLKKEATLPENFASSQMSLMASDKIIELVEKKRRI